MSSNGGGIPIFFMAIQVPPAAASFGIYQGQFFAVITLGLQRRWPADLFIAVRGNKTLVAHGNIAYCALLTVFLK